MKTYNIHFIAGKERKDGLHVLSEDDVHLSLTATQFLDKILHDFGIDLSDEFGDNIVDQLDKGKTCCMLIEDEEIGGYHIFMTSEMPLIKVRENGDTLQ